MPVLEPLIRSSLAGTGLSEAHVKVFLNLLDEMVDVVSTGRRSVFYDDFFGPVFDPNRWGLSAPVYVFPGGGTTTQPGGVARLSETNSVKFLQSLLGIVDRALNPRLEARIKLGGVGDLTNMIAFMGLADGQANDQSAWQYNSADPGDPHWACFIGKDPSSSTRVESVDIVQNAWYTMSIEEFTGSDPRVEFGLIEDPTGNLKPPVLHTLRGSNLPATGVTDRRIDFTVVSSEAAEKAIDIDWVELTSNRAA